jgi:hypothetical protein
MSRKFKTANYEETLNQTIHLAEELFLWLNCFSLREAAMIKYNNKPAVLHPQ